jgi:hypothetical protein
LLPSLRRYDPDQVRRVGGSFNRALSDTRTPGNHFKNTMFGIHSSPISTLADAILSRFSNSWNRPITFQSPRMNVVEGLQTIRARLVENEADPSTLSTVDLFIRRASHPAAQSASAGSLLQLVRMLMRTDGANSNVRVYNDLVRLEEELQVGAAAAQARREAEEAKPIPRSKKYYKEQKEREKKARARET